MNLTVSKPTKVFCLYMPWTFFFCIEYSFQYREEKKIRHIFGPNVILSTTQIARHVRIVSGFISREKKPLRLLNTSFM